MRLRFLALVLLAAAAAACGGDPIVPVDATPDADMTDRLDLEPPETMITFAPPALTNQAPARFEFTANEQATFVCKLDTNPEAPCTSPRMINGLPDGQHTFEVYAIDTSNLRDLTAESRTWRIDTIAPDTELIDTPPPVDNTVNATITFRSPGEVGTTFECTLDGSAFAVCTSPYQANNLSDGNHTFRVRAKDAAGNFDPTPAQLDWQVDSVSPDTVITDGPAGIVSATTATFTFTSPGAGPGSTFACRLDTAPFGPCTSPRSFVGLLDGPHTFDVRVTDELGNTDPSPARRSWTIDATGPLTSITMRPDNPSSDLTPTFEFSANEQSTFECQVDGQVPYAPCNSPYTAPALPAGIRFFRVRATDVIGNRGPEATSEWLIDASGPVITITSGPSGPVASTSATFNWNSSEPATFCYRFTGDAQDTCTQQLAGSGTATRMGLAEGAQTFTVTATDALGNAGAVAMRNFTVDTVGPAVTISMGPTNTVGTLSNAFTFTAPETATFCYKVDGGAELCTPPPGGLSAMVTVNSIDGAHMLEVVARDVLGNRTAMAATRSWTVDTLRPTTTIMTAPAQNEVVDSDAAMVQLTASEPSTICWRIGAGAETCSAAGQMAFTADLMGLPEGPVAFSARSSDAIGAGPTVARTWVVDTVRPTVMITGGPAANAIVGSTSTTFIVTSSERSQICWSFNGGAEQCSPAGVTTFSPATSGLPQGANTFSVLAKDAIGPGAAEDRMWNVDTVRPTITISAGPANGSTQGATTASFTADSDQAATICWRFDAGAESCSAAGVMSANVMSAALGDGSHVFEVYGKDTVGSGAVVSRSWTVDTVRPVITITAGPAQASTVSSTTATFTVTSSERATICWSFNGGAQSCTQPNQTSATVTGVGLPAGATSFSVTGADAVAAGNATVRNWTIDVTRPTVMITAGPNEGQRIDAVMTTFTVTSSESSTICWRLDGGAQACSAAGVMNTDIALNSLAQGDHSLAINAADAVGVGATLTRNFVVDVIRPTVTITAGPAQGSATRSQDAAFTVTASEPSTICWKFNNGAESCSAAGQVSASPSANGLPAGATTFEVKASDSFGAGATVSRMWTIDTAAPTVTITAGPAQGATTDQVFAMFTVGASEPSTICWRFNTGPLACSAGGQNSVDITSNPLPPGNNVFAVYAADAVGPGASVVRQWRIDNARPTVTITSGPMENERVGTANVTFGLSASEPSTICWQFDANPQQCSPAGQVAAMASAVGLPDGARVFTATAADNVGPGPVVTRNFVVDTTPPLITISAPPAQAERTNAVNANFTITTDEPATICWKLDGGAESCSAAGAMMFGANLMNLTEGNHALAVWATDVVLNESTLTRNWTVDLTAPTVTISAPPAENGFSNDVNPSFTLSANEPSTICWTLDGVNPATCSAAGAVNFSATFMNLAAGQHTLAVTATDEATNQGGSSRTWTIDLTAPAISISSPPAEGATHNVATVNFTITTDELASICWWLDTGAETCSAGNVTSFGTGDIAVSIANHVLHTRATDRAGNISTSDRSWNRASKMSPPPGGFQVPTPPIYAGMVTAWVRDPGYAAGGILSVRTSAGTCSLRGHLAVIGLECEVGGVKLAPAYGTLGSVTRPDRRWHLVTIAISGDRAELWVDGVFRDRTGASSSPLAPTRMIGASPVAGSYGVASVRIRGI
jgi:hypothetical protein